jgi:predicted NUDIX family NTP pyrophosphohydrolase
MARTRSAGILMYRRRNGAVEVLLVHPGGPFFANKDDGAWSIPKGEFDRDESPADAARREFTEETGDDACGALVSL